MPRRIAVASIASCRRALDDTIRYVKERRAFGKSIASFQNTQFKLVELAAEVEIGQVFVDRLLAAHVRGDDIVSEVSMAKFWTTDLQKRLTAECLQLHGGYGFTDDYPISRIYRDPRVVDQRIQLKEYPGAIRQIVVADLGHEEPTFLLTNQLSRSAPKLIERYAQGWAFQRKTHLLRQPWNDLQ